MNIEILQELKTLRDEVKVQAHLFTMEVKDQWEELEKKFQPLESKLLEVIEDFGKFNEEFWVGDKETVESLIKDYKKMKEHQTQL